MIASLPLTLVGGNLGERHHYLNSAVSNAHQRNEPLQSILQRPEVAPIDRIFKIDLASRYSNVDFIIKNLMDKDMLYVCRALKSQWLLRPEYSHIINPEYLETHIYPEMTTTAVNKMRNFIELKLKDPIRCQEFYEHYKSNFEMAIKFLWHCSGEFIKGEVSNILDKLTPKYLRILCEACPQVAKIYFDGLQDNREALGRYLGDKVRYHNSIMNVLKVDGDLFLDLIEKYFDSTLNPLSSSATRYIMKNYKNRYLAKPELYAEWLLNKETVAMYLSSEEIKDIVMRMARAAYIISEFTYKQAEPFLNRLSGDERAAIKNLIFVDKSIGAKIESWPYPPPQCLILESASQPFEDIEHSPYEYEDYGMHKRMFMRCSRKTKYTKYSRQCDILCSMPCNASSGLDQLFDRYRFVNFDRTFFEFRKMLLTEGTIEGRRNMMLVLISKAGGNEAKLDQLLRFLVERHSNEPDNLRDAVARSMVKRAFVWRLPTETWTLLLKWATTSVREILHATILRHLLSNTTCPPSDLSTYVLDFSDLTEYSLNVTEKACVAERLPVLLISANAPGPLLDTLKAYNLRMGVVPGAQEMLVSAARQDEHILRRLYESRVARRHLLKESFKIFQTDAAYVNALRHDTSALENGERFIVLISNQKPNHDRFLRALALYFSEPDGLAARHFRVIEKAIGEEYQNRFARPLAYLLQAGKKFLEHYIEKPEGHVMGNSQKKFIAALKANAFVIRPIVDIDVTDWRVLGAKFVSNKVMLCSVKDVDAYIDKCLKWKKTMRVALRLAPRSQSTCEILAAVAKVRPSVALKVGLGDLCKGTVDHRIWDLVKPIISNIDLSKKPLQHVCQSLAHLDLKSTIQADYLITVFGAFRKAKQNAMPMLCRIENLLTEVNEDSINEIIAEFLREELNKDTIEKGDFSKKCVSLYFRIIAKYLLISKSEDKQKYKMETTCQQFFDKIEQIWEQLEDKSTMIKPLDDFIFSLKYSKAFLDLRYVSCFPMFEMILERLSKLLPREQYFQKYVHIRLTMMYCRSIRQVLKQEPKIFTDPKLIQDDGVKIVGYTLGKYIDIEIQNLVHDYFTSIVEIYQEGLVEFLKNYFKYNEHEVKLVTALITGLIEGRAESQLLAQTVFTRKNSNYKKQQKKDETIKLLKNSNNEEMMFFLCADIYPY